MTPDYALSLSFDGIALLERAARRGGPPEGWYLLGDVALDTGDLTAALENLRALADTAAVKLLLPNEQIKYLSLPSTGPDGAAQATAALEGATPYPVADLVFDWTIDGDVLQVAAVAQETLAEAESFALEHGFDPVSFVAKAPDGAFVREPFFGVPDGSRIETGPEAQQVVILSDPPPAPAKKEPIQADPVFESVKDAPPSDLDSTSETPGATDTQPDSAPSEQTDLAAPTDVPAPKKPLAPAELSTAETPPIAFASLRADRGGAETTTQSAPNPQAEGSAPPVTAQAPKSRPSAPLDPKTVETLKAKAQASLTEAVDAPAPPATEPDVSAAARTQSGRGRGIGFMSRRKADPTSPAISAKPKAKPGATTGALAADGQMSEAERLTVFGARRTGGVGGKPRFLGLILTSLLLLFLLAVAAWAAVFVDEGLSRFFVDEEPAVETALSVPQINADDLSDVPASDGFASQDTSEMPPPRSDTGLAVLDPSDETAPLDTGPVLAALDPGLPATTPPALTESDGLGRALEGDVLSLDEAETRYATSGIWQRSPEAPSDLPQGVLDDLRLAALDPALSPERPSSLPTVLTPDPVLPPQRVPPPEGAVFQFDARGFIVPTAEGVVTPGGYLLVLGRPDIAPPLRPGTIVGEEEAPDATEGAEEDAALPEPEEASDPAEPVIALLRPLSRPASVLARIEADAAAQAALALRQSQLAEIRPQMRPADMADRIARATALAPASTPISTQVAAPVVPREVSPPAPSRQSVAEAATQDNAINLRRINLVGVYGTPAERRALVRLANGRFQRVEVGDRLDGGRILAISDTQLRYQKGGRNLVLDMPQG